MGGQRTVKRDVRQWESMAGWQRFLQLLQYSGLWTVDNGDQDRGQGLWTGFERLLQLTNPVVMAAVRGEVDIGAQWQHICQT